MINEYEERFQRSLEKLLVPSWFVASKVSIPTVRLSIYRQSNTSQRPQSCRSSLAPSRSPSIHSWHPNYIHDRTHSSSMVPRPIRRYEKGIERVSKSSQWYRPIEFTLEKGKEEKTSIMEKQETDHRSPLISVRTKKRIPSLEPLPISYRTLNNEHHHDDDGVRELSDDEEALREINEDEMNETDEFFLLPQTTANLNRLYTLMKNNDQAVLHPSLPSDPTSDQIVSQTDDEHSSPITDLVSDQISQSSISRSFDGVNEETARIGRLLLSSISHEQIEPFPSTSVLVQIDEKIGEYEEFLDDFPHDSGYSSHQERAPLLLPPPSSSSISHYEPLSDCYSGYSFIPSDFLPTTHQFSSIHSNTDEAYESEPTTMSSSIITSHVHPQLEHEFEYPSPPPPVPDRRLKPAHLTSTSRQETIRYSTIEKVETYSSMKKRNSRDFCGVIPSMEESPSSRTKEKRNHKTLNCLQSSTKEDKKIKVSLLGKSKSKKQQRKDFDEATNGLAICFPASDRKSSIERTTKKPSTSLRVPIYETSV